MRKHLLPASALVCSVVLLGTGTRAQDGVQPGASTSAPADKQVTTPAEAAGRFLALLDDAQRAKAVFAFDDATQRKRWSNFPTGIFQRGGLRMGDLTGPQRAAAMNVLAATLSKQGYEKIVQIVEGDEVLRSSEDRGPGGGGNPGGPGAPAGRPPGQGDGGGRRDRPGGGLIFGRDEYYISFLGQPSETDHWMIQFGGHHLAINITLSGRGGTLSPSHTGAQPAVYQVEGKSVRPLGREADKAFALLNSLDETQRKRAVLGFQIRDLVLGPGHDGQTIPPEGLKGADMTDKQRDMLLDLAGEWVGIMNEAAAGEKMDAIRKNLGETWFAWSGPLEASGGAYFRVQGPTVLIEYAPQRMGGSATNHIHTMYRDPTNEYGRAPSKK